MKPLLIGCGLIIVLILSAVGAAMWFLPDLIKQGIQKFEEVVAAEQERQGLAVNWNAPQAGDTADVIFPAQLDAYRRTSAETSPGIPDLSIAQPGFHAVYEAEPSRVDLFVFPVTKAERKMLLDRIEKIDSGAGSRTWTDIDLGDHYARAYLASSRLDQNQFWFTASHLIVLRTKDSEDRESVLKAFLQANQKPPVPAATASGTDASEETPDADAPANPKGTPSPKGSVSPSGSAPKSAEVEDAESLRLAA